MNKADPSLSLAERLDAICDRFEADWKAGERPDIAQFVAAAPEADRAELRAALLAIELELQGRSIADTSVNHSSVQTTGAGTTAAQLDSSTLPTAIGRFQIRAILGTGAFGKVYRAYDPQLGREVAVKVPLSSAIQTENDRMRFLKEARAAATINHPNVCQIHEVGEVDGRPYIVMAIVPGQSLAAAIKSRREPMPEKQACLVVRKIALALAAAHERGVVHRDLKPANVMYDRERKDIVVMDFGLARGPQMEDGHATQSGVVMGTPAYMSPEQARGGSKQVGPAGDVYSLGVVLYEMLTGQRPFAGTTTEVLGQILHVQPDPPSKHRPGLDARLETLCLKAMAKDPAERFSSMKEFAAALDDIVRTAAGGAVTDTARARETHRDGGEQSSNTNLAEVFAAAIAADRQHTTAAINSAVAKNRRPILIAITIGLLLAGLASLFAGVTFFTRSDKVLVSIDVSDVDLGDKGLTFFLDKEPISAEALAQKIELQPGDHELIVKRGDEIVKHLQLIVRGGKEPGISIRNIPLPGKDAEALEIQPSALDDLDAKDLPEKLLTEIFGGRDKAPPELVAIYTNLVVDKADEDVFWSFSLGVEGKLLASSRYPWTILEIHNLATGKKFGDVPNDGPWITWNKISPDKQSLYYLRKDEMLHGRDLGGKERWRKPARSTNWSVPALSPDGKTILTADADLQTNAVHVLDAATGETLKTWKGLLDGPLCRLQFSPDGKMVAVHTAGSVKFVGSNTGELLSHPVLENVSGEPMFSPGATKLYSSHHWKQAEDYCVQFEIATGKKQEYRLSPHGCRYITPNPVFPILVTTDNRRNVHLWDADKSPNQKPAVINIGGPAERFAWTPEGRHLVIGSKSRIMVLRLRLESSLPSK